MSTDNLDTPAPALSAMELENIEDYEKAVDDGLYDGPREDSDDSNTPTKPEPITGLDA